MIKGIRWLLALVIGLLVIGLLGFFSEVTPFAKDLLKLESALQRMKVEFERDPQNPSIRTLLGEIDRRYYPSVWIREVPSPNWASPSAERLSRIEQIAEALTPFEATLVSIAMNPGFGSDADRAVNLLWYAKPTETLKRSLLSKADSNPIAYRILFETGLSDEEVRKAFVKGLDASSPEGIRVSQRADMAVTWGLVEAIPVYLELLNKPFNPKTISFVGHIPAQDANSTLGGYNLAARAAMHLGRNGEPLLPLIKERFAEVQKAFPAQQKVLTGSLVSAIDVLEGRREPQNHAAMSGRGVINLSVSYKPVPLPSK